MSEATEIEFANALADFRSLAESFAVSSLFSISALQTLAGHLADAVAALLSASVHYLAVKAFDCFLVPLAILWTVIRMLKKGGVSNDVDVHKLLDLLDRHRRLTSSDQEVRRLGPDGDVRILETTSGKEQPK